MHRARHLARLYPDEKILFTAFNRNLGTNIAGLLDTLCSKKERARIDVANIHSWAVGYAGKRWGAPGLGHRCCAERMDATVRTRSRFYRSGAVSLASLPG